MSKKDIIKTLEESVKTTKQCLKGNHTQRFIDTMEGIIEGYKYALILLKLKN